MLPLPQNFVDAVTGAWPEAGPRFLAGLESLIAACAQRWNLRVLSPFALSYNYVAPATTVDGAEVVLKLGVPNPEFTTEIEALRLYGGVGAARLLDADAELGLILLERVRPGLPLAELADDDAATALAAQMMQRLWRPLPPTHPFPDLRFWNRSLFEYAQRYAGRPGPLPWELVDRAVGLLGDLVASAPASVLLHGDFHHWNVLQATREPWLVIDPKGVAGEPAFEVGPLLYNPSPGIFDRPDLARLTLRRIDLLAEHLDMDRQRLAACGFVAAVLSACWSIEEGDAGAAQVLAVARILDRARRV